MHSPGHTGVPACHFEGHQGRRLTSVRIPGREAKGAGGRGRGRQVPKGLVGSRPPAAFPFHPFLSAAPPAGRRCGVLWCGPVWHGAVRCGAVAAGAPDRAAELLRRPLPRHCPRPQRLTNTAATDARTTAPSLPSNLAHSTRCKCISSTRPTSGGMTVRQAPKPPFTRTTTTSLRAWHNAPSPFRTFQ